MISVRLKHMHGELLGKSCGYKTNTKGVGGVISNKQVNKKCQNLVVGEL